MSIKTQMEALIATIAGQERLARDPFQIQQEICHESDE